MLKSSLNVDRGSNLRSARVDQKYQPIAIRPQRIDPQHETEIFSCLTASCSIQVLQAVLKTVEEGLVSSVVWIESPEKSSEPHISGPVYRTSLLDELPIVMSKLSIL